MRGRVMAALLFVAAPAAAQPSEPLQISIAVEAERADRTYHFTNPSSFDAGPLVPHFFEQRYSLDNLWLAIDARYSAAGIRFTTTGGVALPRNLPAEDFDTFFNSDGSVVVSGTTGDARITSLRASQTAEVARVRGVSIAAGYRFRLDRADFGTGHKTITRNGVLVDASEISTREHTASQLHEFLAAVSASGGIGRGWRLDVGGDVSPLTLARLLVQLPDKYPGQDLTFVAKALAASARLRIALRPFFVTVDGGEIWGYGDDDSVAERRLTISMGFIVR
ncbi:MAG: hypothetical protein JF601_06325 [Acidobacteria bacterium]|nr:hypothetical protein [Acidobacteriota bacterium]